MIVVVISPAKTLDFETPPQVKAYTQPTFSKETGQLIVQLKKMSAQKLSALMSISPKLAKLNYERYQSFRSSLLPANAKQALMAFKGDVYTGLDVASLTADDFKYAQKHIRILSGLYGVLKPLDLIQPYRLEMGSSLQTRSGRDLYQFWGDKITDSLNRDAGQKKNAVLVNLASNEYFKSINLEKMKLRVVVPVFKEMRQGVYKIVSFNAKRARGSMTRYILQNRLDKVDAIKKFREDGYSYNKDLSSNDTWLFTRG